MCFKGHCARTVMIAVVVMLCGGFSYVQPQPVIYHSPFENYGFLQDDIMEHAQWRSKESRKLELVEGRFGKALHLGAVPEPFDLGNASSIGMNMYNLLIRMQRYRGPNWCGPFIWCGDKVNPSSGSVSFWIKGKLTPRWKLFYLTTSSFGRVERDLIVIRLDNKSRLSAYVVDARYDRHEVVSDDAVTDEGWKHVVLTWDMSSGLALYLNGELVASNLGDDAWWMALAPGIFHLPSGGCTYDELCITDRPLTSGEVRQLYASNTLPTDESAPAEYPGAGQRLSKRSGVSTALDLPVAEPSDGAQTLVFEEVWTDEVADGYVPGWWVNDGRYVLAWPQPYAFWTITIGDMDYHAEKADIPIPSGKSVNYITVEGNLEGVKVLSLEDDSGIHTGTLLEVPPDHGFFYGSVVPQTSDKMLRIPFVKEWGTPYHYKGGLNMPLTGNTRLHEVDLFNVKKSAPAKGQTVYMSSKDPELDAERYGFAASSLTERRGSTVISATPKAPRGKNTSYDIGDFKRVNVFSEPWSEIGGVASVRLDLYLRTKTDEDVLLVRLRDPGVPSCIWTHAEVKLRGFSGNDYRRLSLTFDMHDLVLADGDRLWLDICSANGTELLVGDKKQPSTLTVEAIPTDDALKEYTVKENYVAQSEFSASNEYPLWVGDVSTDYRKPRVWSGIFDKVYPVQAVRRVDPDNVKAGYLWDYASGAYNGSRIQDSTRIVMKEMDIPARVPKWAAWMREYIRLRNTTGEWWANHQNPDGQFGGGWNDDTTLMIFGSIDSMLDGNKRILDAVNRCRIGLDKTKMFTNGFMQLYPMDRHHTRDPVRGFHNVVLVNAGSPHHFEQAMEIGRISGHPELAPIHYSKGIPFEAGYTAVQWYWGNDQPKEPYSGPGVDEVARHCWYWYSYFDDTLMWFNTESYKELGGSLVDGTYEFYGYFLGAGPRNYPHPSLAISWPYGGGHDVARYVEYADETSLKARIYSFDDEDRTLAARFYRLEPGMYRVILAPDRDGDGNPDGALQGDVMELRRFSDIELSLQPQTPLALSVSQVEPLGDPGPLPDLALDPADIRVNSTFVTVTVHNLGNAPAENFKVTLLADGKPVGTQTGTYIEAPLDYIKRYYAFQFDFKPHGEIIEAVVDPDNSILEIMKQNNRVTAADNRSEGYFDWSDVPYVP